MPDNSLPTILIAGFGDLGAEVARQLLPLHAKVFGVRRKVPNPCAHHSEHDAEMIAADVTQPASLTILETLKPNIIVYCVAAGGQTDAEYQAAYVDGLRNVLLTQQNNTVLYHVFFVSSTRVYGQESKLLLDEASEAIPADFGGARLLEAEQLLNMLPCSSTVLRLTGIYGPGRLRMLKLASSAHHWPKQNSWSNRIHRDDAAAFTVYLIKQVLAGRAVDDCYIVTDCNPVPQYEVLSWLAERLHSEKPAQLPVQGGKRLSNKKMLATGFKLQYPDYKAGYTKLLSAE